MIHLCGPNSQVKDVINTTSRSTTWSKGLSPFFLGPVKLYGNYVAKNVENAWQYSKVYPEHVNGDQSPLMSYYKWAINGWNKTWADRYPMGKVKKPLYSIWGNRKLDYIQARREIYAPLYSKAVEKTEAYKQLQELYKEKGILYLWDFDAYDHRALNMSFTDVLNCKYKKMGHAFVLAMMLMNERVWEMETN